MVTSVSASKVLSFAAKGVACETRYSPPLEEGGADWTLRGQNGLGSRLVLQKWEGSGELCILCPAVVQSCHSILSHFTIHHCLISNNSLENGDREPRHLSTTVGALKALEL